MTRLSLSERLLGGFGILIGGIGIVLMAQSHIEGAPVIAIGLCLVGAGVIRFLERQGKTTHSEETGIEKQLQPPLPIVLPRPIDRDMRHRLNRLLEKNPEFYRFDPRSTGGLLWVETGDHELVDKVYRWVARGEGEEPD